VKVAQGNLSLPDAQAQHLEHLRQEDGEFVSTSAIALLHGVSLRQARSMFMRDGFPAYTFRIHEIRAWYWSDIEAHHAGAPFPEREPGTLQQEIMTSKDVRQYCGFTERELWPLMARESPRVPRAAGRVAGRFYWLRSAVEAWADSAERHG
jgi:predicted DNA-binding transcriptional regulator AlpA